MSSEIQLLWFVQQEEDGDETELLIGVYQTEEDVKAAVERLRNKPGFVDFPEGFKAQPYELNRDHWTEGFVRR